MKNKYVSYNGSLSVKDSNLVNQYGETMILKGISSHGIQWYSHLINKEKIERLKLEFGINAFRIAMYTEEKGYIYNNNLKEKVKEIIDLCILLDLYVIIDWHILKDGNPLLYLDESMLFFDEISSLYKNIPNVIYEICNEPNGDVTWKKDIKPYAEKVIPVIRKNSSKAIIIVGTKNYCQGIDTVIEDLLGFKDILYSLHFYSGTHGKELRDKLIFAKESGVPVIVSEFGVSDAQTNSKVDLEEAKIWIELLKKYNISLFNWSLSDKREASSIFVFNSQNLSVSGEFVKAQYNNY